MQLFFTSVDISTIPLTVIPPGVVADYQSAAIWQDFNSIVLDVDDFTKNTIAVQLYPNPVHDELHIVISSEVSIEKITIYNDLGQLVQQGVSTRIDVRHLKGIYFVEIVTNKGKTTKQIIVE